MRLNSAIIVCRQSKDNRSLWMTLRGDWLSFQLFVVSTIITKDCIAKNTTGYSKENANHIKAFKKDCASEIMDIV